MSILVGLPLLVIFAAFAAAMFFERISALLALPLMAVCFLMYAASADLFQGETTERDARFQQWKDTLATQSALKAESLRQTDAWLQELQETPPAQREDHLQVLVDRGAELDASIQQRAETLPKFFTRPPHYSGQRARFLQEYAALAPSTWLRPLRGPIEANQADDAIADARRRLTGQLAALPQAPPGSFVAGARYLGEYLILLFRAGSLHLYATIIATIFGGMFAMYVRNLKVAERFVYWTAEFAGETPMIVTMAVFLATAVIFSSIGGLGTVIMLGTIILPILRTVGLGPVVAAGVFLIAIAMGGTLHPVSRRLWLDFYGISPDELDSILWTMVLLYLLCGVGWIVWGTRRQLLSSFQSEPANTPEPERVSTALMLAPLLPVALVYFFRIEEITTFIVSIVYMYLCVCTRPGAVRVLSRSLIEGAQAVVPPCLLMIGIGLLVVSLSTDPVQAYMRPLLVAVVPETQLGYILLFSLAAPLALYRGPLNVWGMGLAVSATLLTVSAIPAPAVLGVILAAGMLQGVCDPTNTQNVWIAGYQGVGVNQILRYTILPVWAAAIVAVVIFGLRFFGG